MISTTRTHRRAGYATISGPGKTMEFEFSEDDLSPRKVVVSAARARRLFAQVDDALETLEGA